MSEYLPWIEKYRPQKLTEIICNEQNLIILKNMLKGNSLPHLLFHGTSGTGKTSTIICLAKQIYNEKQYSEYVLELNASDDRGLYMINNTIYPFCKKKTSCVGFGEKDFGKYPSHKLVILDEADSITPKAQNLLSNIISEFRKNTRIVFICNDCTQIIESIQSRCMIVKYPRISSENLYDKKILGEIILYFNSLYQKSKTST